MSLDYEEAAKLKEKERNEENLYLIGWDKRETIRQPLPTNWGHRNIAGDPACAKELVEVYKKLGLPINPVLKSLVKP